MNEITVHDLRAWLHSLGELRYKGKPYAPNSKHGARVAMASIFKFAVRNGAVVDNPFARLDSGDAIARPDDEAPRTITVLEADAIADDARRRRRAAGARSARDQDGAPFERAARAALGGRRPRPAGGTS